ncbi:hypothetical protein QN222_21610 [Sinorhizobium sp. 6-70]|nr:MULTISPECIES: hypothetical protein [unclassified Sinorhizobium]MDK1377076.1 hypothetical protein [Sinorhizobium sp. 6-70]MDK1479629.1 hypothetical protein [Sinorhizobium sp. 6-117]
MHFIEASLSREFTICVFPNNDPNQAMSLTADFIAELIRAANEADRLSAFEVKRLINRSIATIRDMREEVGILSSNRAKDVVIDLQVAAARADGLSATEIRDILIDAAEVIRTLKIVLDGSVDAQRS